MSEIKGTEAAHIAPALVTRKSVPGAPPPVDKTPKKRRNKPKAKANDEPHQNGAAVHDAAPTTSPDPTAKPVAPVSHPAGEDKKASPLIEVLHKRIRNFTKKIQRAREYQAKAPETLNEDQKKVIASLPVLEGVLHELEDTKKSLEPIDALHQQEISGVRAEAASSAAAAATEAAGHSKNEVLTKITAVFGLINLDPTGLDDKESTAAQSLVLLLTSSETSAEQRKAALEGLINGEGEWDGVPYTTILSLASHIPEAPSTEFVHQEQQEHEEHIPEDEPQPEVQADESAVSGGVPASASGGFHFMQESELESSAPSAEVDPAVESTGDGDHLSEAPVHVTHSMADPIDVNSAAPDALDWAAEDGLDEDLPPINSLHAKFGTSGDVTPEAELQVDPTPVEAVPTPPQEQDGFTPVAGRARGGFGGDRGFHRGTGERGRGRGGFRGGRGFRGDDRGRGRGFRGGDRGGFRGGGRGRAAPEQAA